MSALRTFNQQNSRLSAHSIMPASTNTSRRPLEVLPRPDLTTERMIFRPLAMSDRAQFIEAMARSRDAISSWIPLESTDDAYFVSLVEKGNSGDQNASAWRRAGFLNDGRFVGMFNIIKIERGLDWSAEANWWLDAKLAGQGLGSHACQAVVDHALSDIPIGLGLHSLRGCISADNLPSMRVAEKIGFVQTDEDDQLEINGRLIAHKKLICTAIV